MAELKEQVAELANSQLDATDERCELLARMSALQVLIAWLTLHPHEKESSGESGAQRGGIPGIWRCRESRALSSRIACYILFVYDSKPASLAV